jgi:hypothetical protein
MAYAIGPHVAHVLTARRSTAVAHVHHHRRLPRWQSQSAPVRSAHEDITPNGRRCFATAPPAGLRGCAGRRRPGGARVWRMADPAGLVTRGRVALGARSGEVGWGILEPPTSRGRRPGGTGGQQGHRPSIVDRMRRSTGPRPRAVSMGDLSPGKRSQVAARSPVGSSLPSGPGPSRPRPSPGCRGRPTRGFTAPASTGRTTAS